MGKYDKLYDSEGKFHGNYWQFAIYNSNIYFIIALFLFGILTSSYLVGTDGLQWWQILCFVPFGLFARHHYKHWKEEKEGRTS